MHSAGTMRKANWSQVLFSLKNKRLSARVLNKGINTISTLICLDHVLKSQRAPYTIIPLNIFIKARENRSISLQNVLIYL